MDLRQQIVYHRTKKKISRRILSESTGISESHLYKFEMGLTGMNYANLIKVVNCISMKVVLMDLEVLEDKL